MALVIQSIILGILTGSVYALMASGLTLNFGVLDIINIAQGIFVILSAYLSFVLMQFFHLDLFLGLLITMPIMFALGLGIEFFLIRRLRRDRTLLSILVMFAVALVIEGILNVLFTPNFVQLHGWYNDVTVHFAGLYITYFSLFAFLLSIALLGGLYVLVYRTRFGSQLRASMQNCTAASLIGINVGRVQTLTFGIGTALTAVGGVAYGATNLFNAASSYDLIYRLLVIVVLGGLGSLSGALLASFMLLIIGDVVAAVWSPAWSSVVFFVLVALFLRFRPQGFFGRREGRKQ